MPDITADLSRLGQINAAGDEKALFLIKFAGEVLVAFRENNIMQNLHRVKVIPDGKGASFPVIGKADARYHVPGTAILTSNKIPANERIINIDSLLISEAWVTKVDELMNHYDTRKEYTYQLGAALGRKYDKNTMRVACLAARASGVVTGEPGGSVLSNPLFATDGLALGLSLFSCAQILDEKDVPSEGRVCVVPPAQFYLMAQATDLINQDWGGAGAYREGSLVSIANIKIMKSNNVPNDTYVADAGENNVYAGDFEDTVGFVFTKDAIGTVQLQGIGIQATSGDVNVLFQATLLVARYLMGHGILRPSCAIELTKAAPSVPNP